MNESGVGRAPSVDMPVNDDTVDDAAVGGLFASVRALFTARPEPELMSGEVCGV